MVVGWPGATATPPSSSSIQSLLHIKPPRSSAPTSSMTFSSSLRHSYSLPSSSTAKLHSTTTLSPPPPRFRCNISSSPGGPPPGGVLWGSSVNSTCYFVLSDVMGSIDWAGENKSRSILDAFFLGKAFAEALGERIESTVGELLSTVGRLQAEQQKQVQEFQEEVLERAKRAKEKAARGAIEEQVLSPGSAIKKSSPEMRGSRSSTPSSAHESAAPTVSSSTASVDGRTNDIELDNCDEVPPSGLPTID